MTFECLRQPDGREALRLCLVREQVRHHEECRTVCRVYCGFLLYTESWLYVGHPRAITVTRAMGARWLCPRGKTGSRSLRHTHVIGVLLKIAHFGSRGPLEEYFILFSGALKILKTGDLHPTNFDSSPSSHPACPASGKFHPDPPLPPFLIRHSLADPQFIVGCAPSHGV
jgi:hypothetical protein